MCKQPFERMQWLIIERGKQEKGFMVPMVFCRSVFLSIICESNPKRRQICPFASNLLLPSTGVIIGRRGVERDRDRERNAKERESNRHNYLAKSVAFQ